MRSVFRKCAPVVLIALSLSLACERKVAQPPAPPDSPSAAQPAGPAAPAAPAAPEIKQYDGVGVITKVDTNIGSVELNHEEIKGLMPAMTMEWYLKDRKMLAGLKVGAKVDFTIEYIGGG